MGCASSNQEDRKDAKKNSSNGAPKGEANEPIETVVPKQNPYMSLTHKDIFHLKMSWKGIKRNLEETGIAMFINMFESNKDMKNYFEKLKNMDNDQIAKSTVFINHATNVMEALDTTVTELEDAEKTHAKLKKLGHDHRLRNVDVSHIKEMRNPFLRAIEQTLGDRYSDRMRSIYETFIDYVIKAMVEGYG